MMSDGEGGLGHDKGRKRSRTTHLDSYIEISETTVLKEPKLLCRIYDMMETYRMKLSVRRYLHGIFEKAVYRYPSSSLESASRLWHTHVRYCTASRSYSALSGAPVWTLLQQSYDQTKQRIIKRKNEKWPVWVPFKFIMIRKAKSICDG